jgi:hypothetical protein
MPVTAGQGSARRRKVDRICSFQTAFANYGVESTAARPRLRRSWRSKNDCSAITVRPFRSPGVGEEARRRHKTPFYIFFRGREKRALPRDDLGLETDVPPEKPLLDGRVLYVAEGENELRRADAKRRRRELRRQQHRAVDAASSPDGMMKPDGPMSLVPRP